MGTANRPVVISVRVIIASARASFPRAQYERRNHRRNPRRHSRSGGDLDGRFAVGDVRAQTQQALDNIRALIAEAGGSMADVVKCTVYVTDRADWQPMNEVYFANFTRDPPHRVSCIVNGLGSPECLVEIDATAYLGDGE